MTEQEHNNRQFAKALAELCLYYGMDKVPIILNSQQYEFFVEEWNKLNEKNWMSLNSDVEFNKKAMDGQLNDYKIKELNEEMSYHKEHLRRVTLELNKLIEDTIKQVQKDNNG